MKKFVAKLFILIISCGVLIVLCNYAFQNNYGHYIYHMMNEMYDSEANIDVLFLGSSHTYRCYDPKIADTMLGSKTFNAGSSGQGMNTSFYLLKEIDQYHDIKTVYLDTYCGVSQIHRNDAQVYKVSDFMRFGRNKIEMLYSNGGFETVFDGLVSFRRNSANTNIVKNIQSKSLAVSDYSTVTYDNEAYRGEGFVYSFETADAENDATYSDYAGGKDFGAAQPVSDFYYESLIDIIEYCADHNIELVLVNQPMPKRTTDYIKNYDNYVQYMKGIAAQYNIQYWNFDLYKYDLELPMKYYKDGGHLNGEGAEVYTRFFCSFVNDVVDGKIIPEDQFRDHY